MAGTDNLNDARWDRDRYEGRDRAPRRSDGPYAADRGYGHAPRIGPTGIASSYNQTGDFGTSGRYYEDFEGRADYGGYEGGAPGYGPGPGRRDGRDRYGHWDPAWRRTYRESDIVGDDQVVGPYPDYGRADGGYTPDYRERLGREGRSWDAALSGQHRGLGPKGYKRSDERIREDVSDRLTDDPVVDASDIAVLVAAGEVTLDGTVPSRTEKRRAEDCAESVSGVTHVQNNLRVSHLARPGSLAAQTDPRIAAVSEGRDADEAARDLAEDRTSPRLGSLRPRA